MKLCGIKVKNVGRDFEFLTVFDRKTKLKRPAQFSSKVAAREAQLILNRLRTDSAFQGSTITRIVPIDNASQVISKLPIKLIP